jgi:hypothetical protein
MGRRVKRPRGTETSRGKGSLLLSNPEKHCGSTDGIRRLWVFAPCLQDGLEPAKGIEPPTYGLRNQIPPLILKKINKLPLQNADKSGRIRNPRATRIPLILIPEKAKYLKAVTYEAHRHRTRLCPLAGALHHRKVRWLRRAIESVLPLHHHRKARGLLLGGVSRFRILRGQARGQKTSQPSEVCLLWRRSERQEEGRDLLRCQVPNAGQPRGTSRAPRESPKIANGDSIKSRSYRGEKCRVRRLALESATGQSKRHVAANRSFRVSENFGLIRVKTNGGGRGMAEPNEDSMARFAATTQKPTTRL